MHVNSLGDLALRRDDLEGAKTQLEAARDISVRIGDSLGEANALDSLGDLALRCDDLDGAKTHLEKAREIYVRIGHRYGEANALESSAIWRFGAKISMARRTIWRRRGISLSGSGYRLGEANTTFIEALALTREDMVKAEAMFGDALKKYQTINDAWGIAHAAFVSRKSPRCGAISLLFQRPRPKSLRMKPATLANEPDPAGAPFARA